MGSNCAQKCSVNSVCSVREKTPQRFVCVLYHTVVAFFFSQKNTDEQNTRYFTETLSQPISQNLTANRGLTPSPSPNGEGSDHRVTPIYSPILSSPVWVTSHTTPLSIRRGARGEASVTSVCRRRSVGSNCAQKCSVNSVCSVREKTPQRFVCVLYHTVVAFFFSQKNTEEQNTQIFTETLSQPISQNLTATFSSNAL